MQSTNKPRDTDRNTSEAVIDGSHSGWTSRVWHWVVLMLALAFTLIGFINARQNAMIDAADAFDHAVEDSLERIQFSMANYETALLATVASVHASPDRPARAQWQALVETMQIDQRYPGIDSIGLGLLVHQSDVTQHIAEISIEQPGYTVRSDFDAEWALPIVHVEPMAGNEPLIGIDLMRERERRATILKARESRKTAITPPIRMASGDGYKDGFLLVVPIFNSDMSTPWDAPADAFLGVVGTPFDSRELFVAIFDTHHNDLLVRASDQDKLLFDQIGTMEIDHHQLATRTIPMLGREWDFEFVSDAFAPNTGMANAILLAGLVINGLLLAMFIAMRNANQLANQGVLTATQSLRKANSALTHANADLENFSHAATIALRGPIRGILGLTDWIHEDIAAQGSAKLQPVKDHLDKIADRAQRMNDLLSGLLAFSDAGEPAGDPELISVATLRNEICENTALPNGQPSLETNSEFLLLDRQRVVQVLHELIDNAVRHHEQPENLAVTLRVSENSDHYLFEIEDNGPGIQTTELERAFEAFQVGTNKGNSRACGLGLTIARRIAQSVDGTVTARNSEHGGTIMTLRWPKPEHGTIGMEAA